jgi:hypothetical protein
VAKTKAALEQKPDPVPAWVDELGALEKELAPWQAKVKRVEQLRKALRESQPGAAADRELQLQGSRFVAVLGPRGNQTIIDFAALVKRIKAATFAGFATCTLAALEAHVEPTIRAEVTRIEQTGPRSLRVLEKGAA